jgi:uncharacterized protein YkwD
MTRKRHTAYKRIGLCLIACLLGVTIACQKLVTPPPEEPTTVDMTASVEHTTTRFESKEPESPTSTYSDSTEPESESSELNTVTTAPTKPPTTIVKVTTSLTQTTTTTTSKKPTTTTTKTKKKTTTTTTTKPTTSTTTTMTTTTTTTKKTGRPITKANLVAMINEERARIGNSVRVSYGDATLQKIANIRAEEQLRLFGHTRPMPCPGCDYCHGEKDCISAENLWIKLTYGDKYAQGGLAGGVERGWTVEDFLAYVKKSSGHYDQMFKAKWTKFAYGQTAWGTLNLDDAYIYFNYGK